MKQKISSQEYHQKRFEMTKDFIASALDPSTALDGDTKSRSSLIFNCIQLAEAALEELYTIEGKAPVRNENASIHNLADLLKSSED